MNDETIRLKDVSIGYKTRQGVRTVASSITASIRPWELTCLLGRNGVGKSTLLRTLAGFQPRLGGDIDIEGQPLESYSDRELAQKLGVVLTERPNVQQMTVWELVAMGRSPYTGFWGRLSDEDLAELYKRSRMSLIPLRYGAGMKGKVVEAFEEGIPVVSTSIGLEGFTGLPKAITPVDTAKAFAKRILELLADPAAAEQLSRLQYDYIASFFSKDKAEKTFHQIFSATIGG